MFFPFSVKINNCSGSFNNINNPYAKLCVPDVVKDLNVKVLNLVSGTNETRRIEWHEIFKCSCRFHSSDLPLNKPLKFHAMTIIIRSVFEEGGKLYPQAFLDDALYELYKCYGTKKLMFQKKSTLIIQVYRKNVCFVIIGTWYFKDVRFKFEPHVCNECHDVLMTAHELKNIAILNVKAVDFRCIL